MAKQWYWDSGANRYRNEAGRFVAQSTITKYRDNALDLAERRVIRLSNDLANKVITPDGFRTGMRSIIKTTYGTEYVFGRGGLRNMSPRDWGLVGSEVKRQYKFLDGFVAAIENEELSDAQIEARAKLYTNGAVSAYSRGYGESWDVTLPGHPGDGVTQCKANCRCNWRLEHGGAGWVDAYWELGGADPCPGCNTRNDEWYPYEMKQNTAE